MKLCEIDAPNLAVRFWEKVDKTDDCWLWTGSKTNAGYGLYGIRRNGRWKWRDYTHRIAYLLEHKEIPDKLHVCHHCDNPPCVNPDHLFLGTHNDNMQDAIKKGRLDNTGEKQGRSKLTWDDVKEIRLRYNPNKTWQAQRLAKEYGVYVPHIYKIWHNEIWKDPTYMPPTFKRGGQGWQDTEVENVRARREKGETFKAIGASYGISGASIRQMLKRKDCG
jgi:hypothetical protein